jgi:hypothetical protein
VSRKSKATAICFGMEQPLEPEPSLPPTWLWRPDPNPLTVSSRGTVAAVSVGYHGPRTSGAGTSDITMGRLMPTPERTLTWQVRLPTDTQAQKSSSGGSESRSQEENDAAVVHEPERQHDEDDNWLAAVAAPCYDSDGTSDLGGG